MDLNGLQLAVHSLVTSFVQRQGLALAALSEIRPDLLDRAGERAVRPTKEEIKATQSGHWGQDKEWRYFIHGRGCRLVHTVTGEPIEWDGPNVQRFDPHWFVNWLKWLRARKETREPIRIIEAACKEHNRDLQSVILDVLDELRQAGALVLHSDRTNRYELV